MLNVIILNANGRVVIVCRFKNINFQVIRAFVGVEFLMANPKSAKARAEISEKAKLASNMEFNEIIAKEREKASEQ